MSFRPFLNFGSGISFIYTPHLAGGDDEQVVNAEARKHRFGLWFVSLRALVHRVLHAPNCRGHWDQHSRSSGRSHAPPKWQSKGYLLRRYMIT